MSLPLTMIYLHLDVAWIASQASSMCVLCVFSTCMMFVVCHSACVSMLQGVWRVCCLTPLSAPSCPYLLCLQSSVGSSLLFRLQVHSSARQVDTDRYPAFGEINFLLNSSVEEEGSEEQG